MFQLSIVLSTPKCSWLKTVTFLTNRSLLGFPGQFCWVCLGSLWSLVVEGEPRRIEGLAPSVMFAGGAVVWSKLDFAPTCCCSRYPLREAVRTVGLCVPWHRDPIHVAVPWCTHRAAWRAACAGIRSASVTWEILVH